MARYSIVRPATREAWLEERKKGIGSSEVGVIAGVSRFRTPIGLWRLKSGLDQPEPENSVMAAGHEFEPLVAYKYALATGDVMDPLSEGDWIAVDTARPYLRVSPDRLFWDKGIPERERTGANSYIVECKTTKAAVTAEDYPKSWYFQVQYQMGVLGRQKAVIAWFSSAECLHFGYVEVRFNPAVYAEIVRMLSEFWTVNVLGGVMPTVVLTNDDASRMWPDEYRETVSVADEGLFQEVRKYNELSTRHSDIEKEMEDIKLHVKTFMKTTSELRSAEGRTLVTWKSSGAQGTRRISFRKGS